MIDFLLIIEALFFTFSFPIMESYTDKSAMLFIQIQKLNNSDEDC